MMIFELEVWDDSSTLVSFYTIRKEGDAQTETDKFFEKSMKNPDLKNPLQELTTLLLKIIGEQFGANEVFFRQENSAKALPSAYFRIGKVVGKYKRFPLRLY